VAKELIFMGRKDGKVRLALFDSSHGVARKLPVKEVPEEVFVQGIKEETLPVRGFGVIGAGLLANMVIGTSYRELGKAEPSPFSVLFISARLKPTVRETSLTAHTGRQLISKCFIMGWRPLSGIQVCLGFLLPERTSEWLIRLGYYAILTTVL